MYMVQFWDATMATKSSSTISSLKEAPVSSTRTTGSHHPHEHHIRLKFLTVIVYCVLLTILLESIAQHRDKALLNLRKVSTAPASFALSSSNPTSIKNIRKSVTIRGNDHVQNSYYAPCTYEGHCEVGYTCVTSVNEGNTTNIDGNLGGICRPYLNSEAVSIPYDDKKNNKIHPCIQQCLHYTHWNEQFYYEAIPDITSIAMSDDYDFRPPGCLVRYRRVFQKISHDFSVQTWQHETGHRRVVRVDPIGPRKSTVSEQEWIAFCYSPCSSDNDCGMTEAFECVNTTCKRRGTYWKQVERSSNASNMVIVSGATSNYFNGLKNLAGSVQYWAPETGIVIYNLGMTAEQINEIETWANVLQLKWKDGFPSHFPLHVHIGKQYAWKPLAINESLHEYNSIFWLDAGSTLVGPLNEVERIVQETGLFLVHGQDLDMKVKSNPLSYEYFGLNKTTFIAGPHFGSGTQAFLYPSRYVDSIVVANAECALNASCIVPVGSSLSNHRYDQTTLSILAYMPYTFAPHHTEYLVNERERLSIDLHTRSGNIIVWTARQACKDFVGDLKITDALRGGDK